LQNSLFVLGKGGGFENALQDGNLFHGALHKKGNPGITGLAFFK